VDDDAQLCQVNHNVMYSNDDLSPQYGTHNPGAQRAQLWSILPEALPWIPLELLFHEQFYYSVQHDATVLRMEEGRAIHAWSKFAWSIGQPL